MKEYTQFLCHTPECESVEFSGKHSFTLHPSLDPYGQNHRQRDDFILVGLGNLRSLQVHSLHVGWRNLFSSCAVVSVFVLVGNRFWFYIVLMYLEYHTVVVLC